MVTNGSLLPIVANAQRTVSTALRQTKLSAPMDRLYQQFPDLADANARLAGYLTTQVRHPHTNKPLLHACYKEALALAVESRNVPASRWNARDRYLDGLVDRASLVLRYEISKGQDIWNPLEDGPLASWMGQGTVCDMILNPTAPKHLISVAQFKDCIGRKLTQPLQGNRTGESP